LRKQRPLFNFRPEPRAKPVSCRIEWNPNSHRRKLVKLRALQEASLENPYNILGVSPTASTDDIKKAYRALAMRHHPDRNPSASAEVRFNAIKKAYELLSDPQKRAEYNYSQNNRIVIDPAQEAQSLWGSLFNRCGIELPRSDR